MKLSIVIVSYNVRLFLEQALHSVYQSVTDFKFEVCVVDNGSDDDSVDMVKKHFPETQLLETGANLGFAKANNIAAKQCQGEYLLLLNPDTILKKDTLQKSVDFLEDHPKAGALGVKMYDGGGQFLPESKRGFPGPWTAFCKITGLNNLFPTSKLFNYYYLGHLEADEDHDVDVLTGAFMMMKRQNYLDLKGLDEDFFMYGEDIDLCYRLHEKGHQNYYLASASIIHFKGESTSKQTVKYITTFYNAMSIYAQKHYNKRVYKLLSLFIQAAIYGRAALAIFFQRFKKLFPVLRDAVFVLLLALLIIWAFDEQVVGTGLLLSAALFPLSWALMNAYTYDFKWWNFSAPSITLFMLFTLFSVLFSNNILLCIAIAGIILNILKIVYRKILGKSVFLPDTSPERLAGILSDEEGEEIIMKLLDVLPNAPRKHKVCNQIDINDWIKGSQVVPGEIIFDPRSIEWDNIVNTIIRLSPGQDFRILSYDRTALITSLSKNHTAKIVTQASAQKSYIEYKMRNKRVSDCVFSCFVLLSFPYFLVTGQGQMIQKAFDVLTKKNTWVGVENTDSSAVFQYGSQFNKKDQVERAQQLYTFDYTPLLDWKYLFSRI